MLQRRLSIALAISCLALSLYVALVPGSEKGSLGRVTSDHYSHYGASVLFWHRGLAIYNTPVRQLCGTPSTAARDYGREHELNEADLCDLEERAGERPLAINWAEYPRPYPPGQLLFTAPEALLYARTDISAYAINRLTVIKDVIVGHIVLGLMFAMLFGGVADDERRAWRSLGFVIAPALYFGIIPWAMAGFYDPIAIACLCLGVVRLRDERPIASVLWLALAGFFHYRAIWYAPLGLVALLQLRRPEQRVELATVRGRLQLGTAVALLGLSGIALAKVSPYLTQFPSTNDALLARGISSSATLNLLVLVVLVGGTLAAQRQWILCGLVVWQTAIIGCTVQAQTWHAMFLLPLLLVARWQRAKLPTIVALLCFIVGVTRVAFNAYALPGHFLRLLLHGVI